MSRDMTPAQATQVQQRQTGLALFCELHFLNSVQYVWSGVGVYAWNGVNWLGLGSLGQVGVITEDSALNAQSLSISLSGIDPTLLAEALTEVQQGLPVRFYLATFDGNGNLIISPTLCYAGELDQIAIQEDTSTATVSIAVENRMSDLQRKIERRFTDRDQRLNYPNDTGFAYVSWTMDWNGAWGTTTN